jgi:hypothetical protein
MRSDLVCCSTLGVIMDWSAVTRNAHERTLGHGAPLSSLPMEWERELAALWRLETDLNDGLYLDFLTNWGRESYHYASRALEKIGARRMAAIVHACQALVDEHITRADPSVSEINAILPSEPYQRIIQLSLEFVDYPENVAELGMRYFQPFIAGTH